MYHSLLEKIPKKKSLANLCNTYLKMLFYTKDLLLARVLRYKDLILTLRGGHTFRSSLIEVGWGIVLCKRLFIQCIQFTSIYGRILALKRLSKGIEHLVFNKWIYPYIYNTMLT